MFCVKCASDADCTEEPTVANNLPKITDDIVDSDHGVTKCDSDIALVQNEVCNSLVFSVHFVVYVVLLRWKIWCDW